MNTLAIQSQRFVNDKFNNKMPFIIQLFPFVIEMITINLNHDFLFLFLKFLASGEEGNLAEVFRQLSIGNNVHNAPFKFKAKNGDIKFLIVDSNVNFNEDNSFRHTR
jgi:hypothetical protein